MISVRYQPESQYMSGSSWKATVFLAKRASTSDADGAKAFLYQVSASESYWSSQETSATTFLTVLPVCIEYTPLYYLLTGGLQPKQSDCHALITSGALVFL